MTLNQHDTFEFLRRRVYDELEPKVRELEVANTLLRSQIRVMHVVYNHPQTLGTLVEQHAAMSVLRDELEKQPAPSTAPQPPDVGMIDDPPEPHDCLTSGPGYYLFSGDRQDGENWTCPTCGKRWVHWCDEAEGCSWEAIIREIAPQPDPRPAPKHDTIHCPFCDSGLTLSEREVDAVCDLSKRLDISPDKVWHMALALFQLHTLGEPALGPKSAEVGDAPVAQPCACGECFFLAEPGSKYCKHHRASMEAYDVKHAPAAPSPAPSKAEHGLSAEPPSVPYHPLLLADLCDPEEAASYLREAIQDSPEALTKAAANVIEALESQQFNAHLRAAVRRETLRDFCEAIEPVLQRLRSEIGK